MNQALMEVIPISTWLRRNQREFLNPMKQSTTLDLIEAYCTVMKCLIEILIHHGWECGPCVVHCDQEVLMNQLFQERFDFKLDQLFLRELLSDKTGGCGSISRLPRTAQYQSVSLTYSFIKGGREVLVLFIVVRRSSLPRLFKSGLTSNPISYFPENISVAR